MRATTYIRSLCCVPVEGVVTALGYFQASAAVVGILVILRQIVIALCDYMRSYDFPYYYKLDVNHVKFMSLFMLVPGLILILAIFLLVGVKKRRPGFVLTYFVISLLAALTLAGFILYCVSQDPRIVFQEFFIMISLPLFVYLLCLTLVYLEYRNIVLENSNQTIYNMLQEIHYCASDIKKIGVV